MLDELRLLCGCLDQRELAIRVDDGQRQPGKSGASANISDASALQVAMDAQRVEQVLDDRLPGVADCRQVEATVPVLQLGQQCQQLIALLKGERNPKFLRAAHEPQAKVVTVSRALSVQFFTRNAISSFTGRRSSLRESANACWMSSVCLGAKCVATLDSNFLTSTGMPSARRLRWPIG